MKHLHYYFIVLLLSEYYLLEQQEIVIAFESYSWGGYLNSQCKQQGTRLNRHLSDPTRLFLGGGGVFFHFHFAFFPALPHTRNRKLQSKTHLTCNVYLKTTKDPFSPPCKKSKQLLFIRRKGNVLIDRKQILQSKLQS